jgi:DNA polymerase I-like protein with 3'-5' exonuclease and polymerase domains
MISSNVVLDKKRLQEKVKYYLDHPLFACDSETTGDHRGDPVANQVTWLSFATAADTFVLPIGHPNGNRMVEPPRRRKNPDDPKKFIMTPARWDDPPAQIHPADAFEILEPLFFHPDIAKTGSGFKFDVLTFAKYYGGRLMPGPFHDTVILDWLLNENNPKHGLKDVVRRKYKRVYDKENVGRRVEIHPFNKVAGYAYLDAKYAYLQTTSMLPKIEEEGLQEVYDLEMEIFRVLCEMENEGIPVDVDRMIELEKELSTRRTKSEGEVYRAAGKKFNINSNPQKVDIFYGPKKDGNQGLKPWKLTKGGLKKRDEGLDITLRDYSTDKESLERFSDNPLVSAFLDFQEVDRVLGTYIQGYLGDGEKKLPKIFEGLVYPDFVQYGTVTGRFSCRDPNLQNIPRPDTDLGKEVRALFVAGDGHKLIVSDYGQVELVVLAHFVGRGALYEGFFDGIDPHTMTAAMVFDQDPQELTARVIAEEAEAKKWRQIAKNLNFAIVYGAGPDKVASMSKVGVNQAKGFLDKHESEFPEIYAFKEQVFRVARSRKPPHLRTLAGRKRRVPSIMSRDYKTKGRGERQLFNSLIQGSAADLIKVSMIRTNQALREADCGTLLLTVHDELVARAPTKKADLCAEVVREAMIGDGIQKMVDVPLSIDLKVVDKWSEAK